MDTDELSTETYEAVIIESEKFHGDLALQFGLIAFSREKWKKFLKIKDTIIFKLKFGNNRFAKISVDNFIVG